MDHCGPQRVAVEVGQLDDEVFENPHTFDILCNPNPHVGFGGTGAHYCIGANLARMTINLIFNAVALYEVIGGIYDWVGFDVVDDAVFRDLVIARIVEPTSGCMRLS